MMATANALAGCALTDPGRRRLVNEDRVCLNVEAGLMVVVDGVGGQQAGERAAELFVEVFLERMAREDAPMERRVREGICLGNNAVFAAAQADPDLAGMGCVVAAAALENGEWIVANVGDARILEAFPGGIRRLTRDHSPIAALEESGQITEAQAMAHPKRNLVSRDVGERMRTPNEPGFIDVARAPYRADALLAGCSDGVTDLLTCDEVRQLLERHAGDPHAAAQAIIDAANERGGKDNITIAILTAPEYAGALGKTQERKLPVLASAERVAAQSASPAYDSRWWALVAVVMLLLAATAALQYWRLSKEARLLSLLLKQPRVLRVSPHLGAIGQALAAARPGDLVLVGAGEYRESLALRDGVTVSAEVLGAVVLASPGPVAVLARGLTAARLQGLRIQPASEARLETGILAQGAAIELDQVEITGALSAAVHLDPTSQATIRSAFIHDNPGTGIRGDSGARMSMATSVLMANGLASRIPALEWKSASPELTGNAFGNNGAPLPLGAERGSVCGRNLCSDLPPPRLRSSLRQE